MRYLSIVLLFLTLSCTHRKPFNKTENKVGYIYTDHDSIGNPLDSLKLYYDLPYERSLVFYEDTDSLEKNVEGLVYFSIFKVNKSKFAIIADSSYTSFYKFIPGGYKRLYHIEQPLGMKIENRRTDLNGDGFKDVWLTISSGGSYGDDNYLLFYEPLAALLIYNEEPELRNLELEIAKKEVRSFTRFTSDTYKITNFYLHLKESTVFLQKENDNKKVVTSYDEAGKVIHTDTLALPEGE